MPNLFSGVWINQHGSNLELEAKDGKITGRFDSGVGDEGQILWVDISGQYLDDIITFHAKFEKYKNNSDMGRTTYS
ncbi:avidin/streptavidin family protein [Fundidesulfovibrio terrae]|uniref:avidin/streptavidin family protein n=1 Tax=Fundidesulfovibrio terrae TaxID=2922866 RepID=UPI001FAF0AA6|nr:avidin/streptavidin family protein [Fundidesulfovibrio terrae]